MPMLTSLTLEDIDLVDENLNNLNKCFPNLQVLNMVYVKGLKDPKIHHLNLQACHWDAYNYYPLSLTLITPNLITLKLEISMAVAIHVEAPMLSQFHLILDDYEHVGAINFKKCENLKTLSLESPHIISLLSKFPITQTVETLTLNSQPNGAADALDSKLSLAKVFMVFPNVSSLCINSTAWSEIEAWLNTKDRVILGPRKRLKTICAYLRLFNPSSTLSSVACVLDHCVGLSEVYLLIHADVVDTVSESFIDACVARWPGLKWRWEIWSDIFN